jgi:ribose-phosphate pyrophosphokinase
MRGATQEPILFALGQSSEFGARIAGRMGVELSAIEEREFDDGEHKTRSLVSVRGRDVFVVHSLYGDANRSCNDKLCRLLFFLGALRDAGAANLTAVVPYLCYARKDVRTQSRDPVTTRYVASLFEAVGVHRVVTLDVHNVAAFQNAFRCLTENLDTANLFARYFVPILQPSSSACIVSPDPGGLKRAERLRQKLGPLLPCKISLAVMEKTRAKGVLSTGRLIGEVEGAMVIIVDDLIGTGSTLAHAARICRQHGAVNVYAAAAHGLFVGDAPRILVTDDLDAIVVTDSVPPFRLPVSFVQTKLRIVSVVDLFAEAIQRLHVGGSIVELLEG